MREWVGCGDKDEVGDANDISRVLSLWEDVSLSSSSSEL